MKLSRLTVLVMILSLLAAGVAFAGKDLDAVKKKGFIQAGVNGGVFGFGMPDSKGVWKGLDVDTARAVAAAIFGDASKVKFTPLTAQQRFTAKLYQNTFMFDCCHRIMVCPSRGF